MVAVVDLVAPQHALLTRSPLPWRGQGRPKNGTAGQLRLSLRDLWVSGDGGSRPALTAALGLWARCSRWV